VFYFCQFLGVDVSAHHAFVYPLGQLLDHVVPFCPVLVRILCFNERINDDDDDDDDETILSNPIIE